MDNINLLSVNTHTEPWIKELRKTFNSGWIAQAGKVKEFEEAFAEKFRFDYALGLNSGTAALELAFHLAGIKKGDKVLTPVLTCTATNIPLVHRKAKIKFVDIDRYTLTMNFDDFYKKVRRAKAIVTVNLGGIPCDPRIYEVAKERKIPVIIDACQSLGVPEPYGDYICYSFQAIKHFTCFQPDAKVIIPRLGRNGKMTKNIKDIKIGDNVLTYNQKTSKKQIKKVTNKFERNYKGQFIKLKLSNHNELEMTEEHPVFVIGKGWINVNKIKIGDKVLQYKYYGLAMRLNGKKQIGKTVEQIFGEKTGQNIRKKHSEQMSGENHWNYGNNWSENVKEKIRQSEIGKNIPVNVRQKMSIGTKKYWNELPIEEFEIFKEKMGKISNDPIISEKRNKASIKRLNESEIRRKISKGVIKAQNEENYWEKYYKGVNRKPNKSEIKLQKIINELCPNEFVYNGDFSLGVVLDRLIPDFVNINGKKKVIELFGDYWHSKKIRGISIEEQIKDKTKRYKKTGFESLFILENELKNIDKLKSKLENFIYNPNTEIVEVVDIEKYECNGKVYNIETEDNHNYFVYGILVHNCGDGGMLIVRNEEDYQRGKNLRWFGIDRDRRQKLNFNFTPTNREMCMNPSEAGFKLHMNDISATMGLVGMKYSDNDLERRTEIVDLYYKYFGGIVPVVAGGSYWLFGILLANRDNGKMDKIKEAGIGTDLIHLRNDIFDIFGKKRRNLPNMNYIEPRYLYLPMHTHLTNGQVEYVAKKVLEVEGFKL